ncbi:dynactin [Niveomyces insectorum RCEF 264]|uniref:Dynactin n=1 Tax=Niveomyces insectorum RCEF 264 TaxID=1081102 RepID=A0A167ZAB8_9HYPO|nr:dynactin [Niveomyces insectorum RCEF 264]
MEPAVGQTVKLGDGRRGIIRFVGDTLFAPGEWVGVELEKSTGKNDGSVQGERYFSCAMGRGMFLRPSAVTMVDVSDDEEDGEDGREEEAAAAPPPPRQQQRQQQQQQPRQSAVAASRNSPGKPHGRRPQPFQTDELERPKSQPTPTVKADKFGKIADQVPHETARNQPVERVDIAHGHTIQRPGGHGGGFSGVSRSGTRPTSLRATSGDSGNESSGSGRLGGSGGRRTARASPPKSSDDEILSPQPTSPVQSRAAALEKLTAAASAAAPKTGSAATGARQSSAHAAAAAASGTPPTRPTASSNVAAANREIEDLKAKLRVLERKRLEDRDKIKQLDKLQGDCDKYQSIIQKLQTKYQPQQQENNALRKQLKEAEARLEAVETMQAEHDSAMELATLDREMAEETAEVFKAELEAVKLKTEELELEVEVLRGENAEFTQGMTPEEKASAGWLQMERTNERLRAALLRLRDLAQQQEEELRDEVKALQEDVQELTAVKDQHAATQAQLAQAELVVDDLRQQLDAAQAADDMIMDLTERNMSQAEQVEELKAVIEDLENLKEINDELEINHVQNERELQGELDFQAAVIQEQARRAAQQEETLEDAEYALSRFREMVTALQSDLEDMRASHAVTENESEQLTSKSRAMMDLNLKLQLSAAKAQVKTIDLELRRMEAQEAEQHLGIVQLFLPDAYHQSDRNSVLALLRFRRLAFKANLLNGFVRERIGNQQQPPEHHPGHEDDVFAGCDVVDKLTWVAAMCDRFVGAISRCSTDQFARFDSALYELEPVERALNAWIDGLRRDELKEQTCADELQRSIALLSHLAEVHMAPTTDANKTGRSSSPQNQNNNNNNNGSSRSLGNNDDEEHDGQDLAAAKVVAGKAVRALEELAARSLALTPDTLEAFEQCEAAAQVLAVLARRTGLALHALLHEAGRTEPFTYAEVQTVVHNVARAAAAAAATTTSTTTALIDGSTGTEAAATITVTDADDADLFAAYLAKLRTVASQVADVAALSGDLSQTLEFERPTAPWIVRGQDARAPKTVPVDAEEELRRLREELAEARRVITLRDNDLGTAQLKILTLESRMRDVQAKAAARAELEQALAAEQAFARQLKEDIEKQDRELNRPRPLEEDGQRREPAAGPGRRPRRRRRRRQRRRRCQGRWQRDVGPRAGGAQGACGGDGPRDGGAQERDRQPAGRDADAAAQKDTVGGPGGVQIVGEGTRSWWLHQVHKDETNYRM